MGFKSEIGRLSARCSIIMSFEAENEVSPRRWNVNIHDVMPISRAVTGFEVSGRGSNNHQSTKASATDKQTQKIDILGGGVRG